MVPRAHSPRHCGDLEIPGVTSRRLRGCPGAWVHPRGAAAACAREGEAVSSRWGETLVPRGGLGAAVQGSETQGPSDATRPRGPPWMLKRTTHLRRAWNPGGLSCALYTSQRGRTPSARVDPHSPSAASARRPQHPYSSRLQPRRPSAKKRRRPSKSVLRAGPKSRPNSGTASSVFSSRPQEPWRSLGWWAERAGDPLGRCKGGGRPTWPPGVSDSQGCATWGEASLIPFASLHLSSSSPRLLPRTQALLLNLARYPPTPNPSLIYFSGFPSQRELGKQWGS